jgi:hypothetical protein
VAGPPGPHPLDGLAGAVDDGVQVDLQLPSRGGVVLLVERDSGMIPALLTSTSIGPSRVSTTSRKTVKALASVTSSASARMPPS